MWTYSGIKVHWLGHDSFVLEGSKTIIIDPFQAKGNFKADLLLISHEHYDHLSPEDIRRFTTPATRLVAPKVCEAGLSGFKLQKTFLAPDSRFEVLGTTIETIPAYNLNKFRTPGEVFHPRRDGRVGFIVTLDNIRFYHAGDSDATPEMKSLKVDVAFLPVSGTYVMTAEEAAEACAQMKPEVAVPMHFNKIVGTRADAERFKRLVGSSCRVEILDEE